MKKCLIVISLLILVSSNSFASIINSADVGGYKTFQDQNTGRIWLDLNNFFNVSTTAMVAAAAGAGFTFATRSDVEQLLNSLPLSGSEWSTYSSIMGSAPNRQLIWGSYYETSTTVGWAWSYSEDTAWWIESSSWSSSNMFWSSIPNADGADADMNIWAYKTSAVPEPATMILLGFGLIGLAGLRRK